MPATKRNRRTRIKRETYSVDEVAALIGCGKHTVYRLQRIGDLRAVPRLRPMKFSKTEVDKFVKGAK